MRLKPIIDYLNANKDVLQEVGPADKLTPLDEFQAECCPAAYVHLHQDKSLENQVIGGTSQHRVSAFAVIVVARDVDMDTGVEELEDAREEVDSILLGYRVDNSQDFIQHMEGEIVDLKTGLIAYRDVYRTTTIKTG